MVSYSDGIQFNKKLLSKANFPFFIAGGIKHKNVKEFLKTNAIGIDIAGGIETNGKQDSKKILKIFNTIKS